MARFLSDEWFSEVERHQGDLGPTRELVVEQVVTGTPDGEVRYRVVAGPAGARVERGLPAGASTTGGSTTGGSTTGGSTTGAGGLTTGAGADICFTTDYPTAVAMARGQLSPDAALSQGRVRVAGAARRLVGGGGLPTGIDLLPTALRETTTY